MCELLHAPSSTASLSENNIFKLLMPNQSGCGLVPHANPLMLASQLPIPVQSPLPQTCKSDKPPAPTYFSTPKVACGTKSDSLIGLPNGNSLVNPYPSPVDPKLGSDRDKPNQVAVDRKGFGIDDNHSCSSNKATQPIATFNPTTPTPPVVSGSGYGTTPTSSTSSAPVIPVTPVVLVIPPPQREPERKVSGAGDNHNCNGNKVTSDKPIPSLKLEIPVTPPNPLPITRPPIYSAQKPGFGDGQGSKLEPEHKESKDSRNCSGDKPTSCHPVPCQPTVPVPPTPTAPSTPPIVTGSGYGTGV